MNRDVIRGAVGGVFVGNFLRLVAERGASPSILLGVAIGVAMIALAAFGGPDSSRVKRRWRWRS